MKIWRLGYFGWVAAGVVGGTLLAGGCSESQLAAQGKPAGVLAAPAENRVMFASDDEAFGAMLAALKGEDHERVHQLLGPEWKDLVSGDKVEDANAFKEFVGRAGEKTRLEKVNGSTSVVHVGKDDWAYPIPITRTAEGKWYFDTDAGKEEILYRRIGENELDAIDVCRAYVAAQREYAKEDRDGSDVVKFSQRMLSTPGKKDGLYWKAAPGEAESPLGKLVAAATREGYEPKAGDGKGPNRGPYHGYRFRILKGQGSAAPGGKFSYVIHGNMVAGFALVAFPQEYRSSGVMTFVVNERGKVYQKDLGAQTEEIARGMREYNPDESWELVKE